MLIALVHGLIIALFLGLGARWPRPGGRGLTADTLLNLANGVLLFGLRTLFVTWAALSIDLPRCDLSSVKGFGPQLLVVFLISDFTRYWVHYLHHRIPLLWRFHAVHHSTSRLDATAGLRMHLVDFVQLSLIPVVLFGMLFDVSSFDPWVWPALVIITDLFDAFQHADIDMSLNHPLATAFDWVFNNPVFHSWHHSIDPGALHGNYGQALTIWDRIFQTHVPHTRSATTVGLPSGERLRGTLWGLQMLRPEGATTARTEHITT